MFYPLAPLDHSLHPYSASSPTVLGGSAPHHSHSGSPPSVIGCFLATPLFLGQTSALQPFSLLIHTSFLDKLIHSHGFPLLNRKLPSATCPDSVRSCKLLPPTAGCPCPVLQEPQLQHIGMFSPDELYSEHWGLAPSPAFTASSRSDQGVELLLP